MQHPGNIRDMGRPKQYDLPKNMTFDSQSGRWIVRNPLTKRVKKFSDEAAAHRMVKALNEWIATEGQLKALEHGRPTIAGLVAKWEADRLQFMPWDTATKANNLRKMRRIAREIGERTIAHTDCLYLEDWLAKFCNTADQFNKWRYILVLLWRFAVSRKIVDACEPEKIEWRSTSKKLEINRKVRRPLDLEGFKAIHDKADPWLQLAMELSVVTLQARLEVCRMQHSHFRDGHLFVIRDKVAGESDMAFIKIAVTAQLEEFRSRSRALDSTVSPYLIHRAPDRRRQQWTKNKPHWTYVNPDYLSKALAAARGKVDRFACLPERERPPFHEIRGLGSRLYRERGMSEAAIQSLMTHAHRRTTQIYLEGGAQALTDADYQPVIAPMTVQELMKG